MTLWKGGYDYFEGCDGVEIIYVAEDVVNLTLIHMAQSSLIIPLTKSRLLNFYFIFHVRIPYHTLFGILSAYVLV